MEPKSKIPPPKRRKRRAKKTTEPIVIGTIQKYFRNLHVRKECDTILAEEAKFPVETRKRKGDVLEATEPPLETKSRRLGDDTAITCTTDDSRTNGPLLLGGISETGRDPLDRPLMGAIKGNGLDLIDTMEQNEMEGGMAAYDWTRKTEESHK